jgi:integrase
MARKGTGLSISERTNGSFRAQIRKKGYPNESRDFLSHAAADEWGMRRLGEIQATGRLVDRRPSERALLSTAIEAYIEQVTLKRPSEDSRVAEECRLRRFLREEGQLCAHAIAFVTPEAMEDWRDRRLQEAPSRGRTGGRGHRKEHDAPAGRLKKDGTPRKNAAVRPAAKPVGVISPATVRREMTLLKRVFDFCMKKYKLAANPLDKALVDRPSVEDGRDVRISVPQWDRLLQECSRSTNAWLAPYVEMALEVGARRGSLHRLAWSDTHTDKAYIVLRRVKNSNNPDEVRNVEVGLSPRAIQILESMPRSLDGRVFPTSRSAITSAFKRARKRADVEHFRLHDARHELASRLVEAGWEMLDVMRQGDWRDPKSLSRYYNAKGEHLGAKLAKMTSVRQNRPG